MPIHVNVTSRVENKSIRRETHNGREHWVVPSHTLPFDVVMNGILYPKSEIEAHYSGLEGTLAPLGHPTINGEHVSAFTPEGINAFHVGAWNRNVKLAGQRVYAEKWIDIEVASGTEKGKRLLDRLEAIERGEDVPPVHSSVALFIDRVEVNESEAQSLGYEAIAKIRQMDHDAILLDEVGAATPEQGVGLMVNVESAMPVKVNSGALIGESFRERERRLDSAARQKFVVDKENDYAWVADFTEDQVVIVQRDGAKVFGYSVENGAVKFEGDGVLVERQETWVARLPVVNKIVKFFKNRQARPDFSQDVEESNMTAEEQAKLLEAISSQTASVVNEAVKPLIAKVDALEANQKQINEAVTANARAAEKEKRDAVAAKFGEVVANALTGQALDDMFAKCGEARGASPAQPSVNSNEGGLKAPSASEMADFLKGAK